MQRKIPLMKQLVCLALASGLTGYASAETAPQSEPKETHLCWSLFWGAYTRPGCPQPVKNDAKSKESVAKQSADELVSTAQKKSEPLSNSAETKSILFGAVQWQRSKKKMTERAN